MASAVLQHVTERKLAKLDSQRTAYEQKKKALLEEANAATAEHEKARLLLKGVEKLSLADPQGLYVKNIDLFLTQARHDASVPASMVQQWQKDFTRAFDIRSLRYESAALFGRIVTEWIANPNDATKKLNQSGEPQETPASEDSVDFEQIGRKEMYEQRKEWERLVFEERKVDEVALKEYLESLFMYTGKPRPTKKAPIEELREFWKDWAPGQLSTTSLRWAIQGVLKSDLFAGKKRDALLDLSGREAVLAEMVDVLNMDLTSLESFRWEPSPVPVHQRRQLNGKYRVYMDEEIHQALLLQHIGASFGIALKNSLTGFFHTGFKQVPISAMTKTDKMRRHYYLGEHPQHQSSNSVKAERREAFIDHYLLTQLPKNLQDVRDYGLDEVGAEECEEVDEDMGFALDDVVEPAGKSPLAIKQGLLHLAATEMLLHQELHGEFTMLATDFRWFGPSLPHATLMTVLKFLHVNEEYLALFKRFLETPMVFADDGPDATPQVRRRGVPMSHALSDSLGEAVLFCLDLAVNRATRGHMLYRFHDDVWFWGLTDQCAAAWTAIQEFSKVTGLDLNEEKTGSVQIVRPSSKVKAGSDRLPKGEIRWGFLRLDAEKRGWIIDRKLVDQHIEELRRQLSACRSVFAWIQAWNAYVSRFFTINFGDAAHCFGKAHEDSIIATFEHIQKQLFPSGSVNAHLKNTITERFGNESIPDGFLYFPIKLGGLDLRNPFIPHLCVHADSLDNPLDRLQKAYDEEQEAYETAKQRFDSAATHKTATGFRPEKDPDTFMSFEEYTRFREEVSMQLASAYTDLQTGPKAQEVHLTSDVKTALSTSGVQFGDGMQKAYDKWIMQLYGPEIIREYGALSLGDSELLPIGLVNMMRSEKFRWQG